ncbi:MAG: DegV family EDD domain-containing protein [Eggerthellaceae bacterium]|nr:DegV family EDD domain-containing protein [Eggerthellaceae bacterium]
MKTIVSADYACDLSPEIYSHYDIPTVPYNIELEGKNYHDNMDINLQTIYKIYKERKAFPKTAGVNIGEYLEHWKGIVDDHGEDVAIVHFCLGPRISCAYQNCCTAAGMWEEEGQEAKVFPINTKTLSSAAGLAVLDACRMNEAGKSVEEIIRYYEEHPEKYRASFVLDNLQMMYAGGRVSTLKLISTSAMSIRPSISVQNHLDGLMDVDKKYRGKLEKVIRQYTEDTLAKYEGKIDYSEAMITMTTSVLPFDERDIVREVLDKKAQFKKVYYTDSSCTSGSHAGPGCLGLLFRIFD